MGSVHRSLIRRSVLGYTQDDTPLILPTRGCLEDVRALMKGDYYIGRGCRQRNLSRSVFCNNYKVAVHGREAAITLFERYLKNSPLLMGQLWTLSGCRLLCHCRKNQDCHGDVIIRQFGSIYSSAHDDSDVMAKAPRSDVLNCMAELREAPRERRRIDGR